MARRIVCNLEPEACLKVAEAGESEKREDRRTVRIRGTDIPNLYEPPTGTLNATQALAVAPLSNHVFADNTTVILRIRGARSFQRKASRELSGQNAQSSKAHGVEDAE